MGIESPVRVAIYVRVSTSDGRQDTENQLAQLKAFAAKQKHWTVAKVYRDTASGKSSDREQYKKMLEDAEKKRFDCLLFWSLDRLSREGVFPTLFALEKISGWGITYRSYTEQYLDSCGVFKDAVVSILATIAKQERLRLSERTKAGLARQKASGKPGPKGYIGPGKPRTVFDEAKALHLRKNEGMSYQQIADACGVPKTIIYRFFQSTAFSSLRHKKGRL